MLKCFVPLCAGKIQWKQPLPTGLHGIAPVLSIPDLDGDQVNDVAIVSTDSTMVKISDIVTLSYIMITNV